MTNSGDLTHSENGRLSGVRRHGDISALLPVTQKRIPVQLCSAGMTPAKGFWGGG